MKVHVNGSALYVEDKGSGEPALVFLHYWGGHTRPGRKSLRNLETRTERSHTTHGVGASQNRATATLLRNSRTTFWR